MLINVFSFLQVPQSKIFLAVSVLCLGAEFVVLGRTLAARSNYAAQAHERPTRVDP
jgi:hypothetical protein